jgi:hypothetical protein
MGCGCLSAGCVDQRQRMDRRLGSIGRRVVPTAPTPPSPFGSRRKLATLQTGPAIVLAWAMGHSPLGVRTARGRLSRRSASAARRRSCLGLLLLLPHVDEHPPNDSTRATFQHRLRTFGGRKGMALVAALFPVILVCTVGSRCPEEPNHAQIHGRIRRRSGRHDDLEL